MDVAVPDVGGVTDVSGETGVGRETPGCCGTVDVSGVVGVLEDVVVVSVRHARLMMLSRCDASSLKFVANM